MGDEMRKQRVAQLVQAREQQAELSRKQFEEEKKANEGRPAMFHHGSPLMKCAHKFSEGAFMGVLLGCSIGLGSFFFYKAPWKMAVKVSAQTSIAFGALFGFGGLMRGCGP